MNTKTTKKYVLPAFAAVFALMFVVAAPNVIAEPGEGGNWTGGDGAYDHAKKMHKGHMAITVEGFTGSIAVPDMSEVEDKNAAHEALKGQVTVKFSEAAAAAENAGLDIMNGSIGIVSNENDERYVVWTLTEMNKDSESETMSKTIFVVDAANVTNTAQVTKEFDHSMMMTEKRQTHGKDYKNTLSDPEKIESKIAKIEQKINDGTLSSEQSDNKVQYVFLLRQLQTAIAEDNNAQVDSLREQLQEIRNQMIDLKKFR